MSTPTPWTFRFLYTEWDSSIQVSLIYEASHGRNMLYGQVGITQQAHNRYMWND